MKEREEVGQLGRQVHTQFDFLLLRRSGGLQDPSSREQRGIYGMDVRTHTNHGRKQPTLM